jgi:DNA repair protein RecN (Recombination protein N)
MLTSLTIKNLALVETLELDIASGMTAITGETGAGKSILIDALNLALGDRADSQLVRHESQRAEVILHFDVSSCPATQTMLREQELDNGMECTLRRTITQDGRSKAYVNDTPVSLQKLRQIGEALVDIHGQHAHHALLHPIKHLELLDHFANNHELGSQVAKVYRDWHRTQQALADFEKSLQDREARLTLLRFQIDELSQLSLHEKTWEALLQEHKQLANAEQLLTECSQVLTQLTDGDQASAQRIITKAISILTKYHDISSHINNALELLNQSSILLDEIYGDLTNLTDTLEINPQQLSLLDQQIGRRHEMARKYRVMPEALPELLQQLEFEFAQLQQSDTAQQNLSQQLEEYKKQYLALCADLSLSRQNAAVRLGEEVTTLLRTLAMPDAAFKVHFTFEKEKFSALGNESVEFVVNTNPGMPWYPMHKIASGGELSRISLAIQVVAAKQGTIPVLVFDEVDVGIGGGTAETVGQLLRRLGETAQVLCITHQPQVASQAYQHWRVEKHIIAEKTFTRVIMLTKQERIEEIARMLGGMHITAHTRAHAQEMVEGN